MNNYQIKQESTEGNPLALPSVRSHNSLGPKWSLSDLLGCEDIFPSNEMEDTTDRRLSELEVDRIWLVLNTPTGHTQKKQALVDN
jgi:hypothetical protein